MALVVGRATIFFIFSFSPLALPILYALGGDVGIWKVGCSIRLRPEFKAILEECAQRERRSFGNLGAVLLEWALEQLKAAGSVQRLLKYGIRPKEGADTEKHL